MRPLTRRARATRAALAITLAAFALPAVPAEAGTYVVYGCRTQTAGQPGGTGVWSFSQRYASMNSYTPCTTAPPSAAFSPIGMDLDPTRQHPADAEMNLTFLAPADTGIQDYKIWRSVAVGSGYNARLLELKRSGGYNEMDRCYASDGCTEKGSFTSWQDNANEISGWNRTDLRGLEIKITCGNADSGSTPCPDTSPAGSYRLHRSDIRLVDNFEPVITAASGPLAAGAPVSGVQSVSFSATDRGGGVHEAWLAVDGANKPRVVVDANGGACARPWRAAVPCKLTASGSLSLNTRELKDGEHEAKIFVSDVTGTNIGAHGPFKFKVNNTGAAGGPGPGTASCNPDPVVGALVMRAGFPSRKGKRTMTTRITRGLKVRGRLTAPNGSPVPGAPICVIVREARAGAAPKDGGTVSTDATGRFAYRLPPGVSRSVTFVHRVGGGAVRSTVRARVRAPVTLRTSRKNVGPGGAVVLSGSLRARADKGLRVELQAHDGRRWRTFASTAMNSDGGFRYRYPFSRKPGTRRFKLRARVPVQRGLPFVAGTSRPVGVTVRG